MFGVPVDYNFTLYHYYWKKGFERDVETDTASEYATYKHCCTHLRAGETGLKLCALL